MNMGQFREATEGVPDKFELKVEVPIVEAHVGIYGRCVTIVGLIDEEVEKRSEK